MSYESSIGSVPAMTSIRENYRSMEKAAWEWWRFILPPSMSVSDRVLLESSLLSYRTALEAGLHKNLSEIVIPGVLTRYDTPQLMQAIFPRPDLPDQPGQRDGARAQKSIRRRRTLDNIRNGQGLGPARSNQALASRFRRSAAIRVSETPLTTSSSTPGPLHSDLPQYHERDDDGGQITRLS